VLEKLKTILKYTLYLSVEIVEKTGIEKGG
jgi:hypothetical protein